MGTLLCHSYSARNKSLAVNVQAVESEEHELMLSVI